MATRRWLSNWVRFAEPAVVQHSCRDRILVHEHIKLLFLELNKDRAVILSKQRKVIDLGEDGQLATHGGIQNTPPCLRISLACPGITTFRACQVGQLPFETFAKIIGGKVVGIIPLGNDSLVGSSLGDEVVVHADQDDLAKSHVIGQLQGDIGDGEAFENAPGET